MTDAHMVALYSLDFALVSAFWLTLEALIQGDRVPKPTIAATNTKNRNVPDMAFSSRTEPYSQHKNDRLFCQDSV